MPQHVIVDGSNLATEGRTLPSLKQLNEAVAAYRDDHPDALITVVVDATFGHRIDTKEVAAFEKAIETNAFVAPPAGAVGRGDGFILSIAQKANASILSNDSYQEFHGEYAWLFDEGRLIGGKPVPHVGWVFVNRVPVRGPVSRRSVKEQKIVDKSPSRGRGRKSASDGTPGLSADGPMPVPKMPPPGPVSVGGSTPSAASSASAAATAAPSSRRGGGRQPRQDRPEVESAPTSPSSTGSPADRNSTAAKSTNDLLAFLGFVEHYPVGTAVTAVVESYSSHGAYVAIGDAKGYVPLRLMADPAPRSAREVMAIGETVTLVVNSFGPARRSIDLAVPAMAPPALPVAAPKTRKSAAKKAALRSADTAAAAAVAAEAIAAEAVAAAASVPADEAKPVKAARGTRKAAARTPRPGAPAADSAPEPAISVASSTFDSVFADPDEPAAPAAAAPGRGRRKAAAAPAGAAPTPDPAPTTPADGTARRRRPVAAAATHAPTPTETTSADGPTTAVAAKATRRSRPSAPPAGDGAASAVSAVAAEAPVRKPAASSTRKRAARPVEAPSAPGADAAPAAADAQPVKRAGGRRPRASAGGS
jgi:hypothetical protein